MTFKIIAMEIKTWLRSIAYNIKNRKKVKALKKKADVWNKKTPMERMTENLEKKSPEELTKMQKRIGEMKLRGHHVLCVKCGKPGGKLGNLVVIVNKDGKKGYIHERCK